MISAMLNGGRDSVQETTESSYNDVLGSVDAWANKYIEYRTARGIVPVWAATACSRQQRHRHPAG